MARLLLHVHGVLSRSCWGALHALLGVAAMGCWMLACPKRSLLLILLPHCYAYIYITHSTT